MIQNNRFLIFGFALSLSLFSCDKKRVFDEYREIDGSWHKKQKVSFAFEQKDTIQDYNMFVNIRNNNDYPYSNLFLIVSMLQPDGVTKVDTLEYQMANPDGTLMGEGFSDVKESKLWYKENARFPKAGKYVVSIQQAVRETGKVSGVEQLQGVSEVGFRIEKTN
ncbi:MULTISPECIES: gliding motility lipoprotein GldH [Flavobacterium]|uniref:gliding motility lipoprotein GldH n=1 Tax=Flavobacterium TaxID=237 RepID=UPI001FCB4FCC|nr:MULTISPECIES: gliding motility lipoprotein GldH [Flavobacterium]UOK43223.1 gliding motility lipoprotein GldH [Flavobacterium enshiense]